MLIEDLAAHVAWLSERVTALEAQRIAADEQQPKLFGLDREVRERKEAGAAESSTSHGPLTGDGDRGGEDCAMNAITRNALSGAAGYAAACRRAGLDASGRAAG